MTLGERLSKFVSELKFKNIPDNAVKQAKKCILDSLGCALYSSSSEHAKILVKFVRKRKEKPECTIIGFHDKSSEIWAALINASLVHGIDFDDTSAAGLIHPSASVVPTVLAVGEKMRISGQSLITATVAGYEVALRIASASVTMRPRGFHPTSVVGAFAAAAATSKIFDLDMEKTTNALGLAGTRAGGLGEYTGSMSKRLNPGFAAQNGIIAALLAKEGITGPKMVLEGDRGFLRAFPNKFDAASITRGLGRSLAITRVGFKPYASVRQVHAPIEAAWAIMEKHALSPRDIEEVIVGKHWAAKATREFLDASPRTVLSAQLSIPYALAVAILEKDGSVHQFAERKMEQKRKERFGMAKKIKVVEDPKIMRLDPVRGAFATSLELVTRNGRRFKMTIERPKGEPENPMTDGEFNAKFRSLASRVISNSKIEKIAKIIDQLDSLPDVNRLTITLRTEAR